MRTHPHHVFASVDTDGIYPAEMLFKESSRVTGGEQKDVKSTECEYSTEKRPRFGIKRPRLTGEEVRRSN